MVNASYAQSICCASPNIRVYSESVNISAKRKAELLEWNGRPIVQGRAAWKRKGTGRRQNRIPFETVPAHLRHHAQAEFNRLVAKCKSEGKPLTQGKIASLMGNAARYANQIVTGKWQSRMCLFYARLKALDQIKQEERLQQFKSQPRDRRMKVLS
jgi:hypothetical protein